MFGPALLVSPVTTYKARSRSVYLPGGTAWYDFWSGTVHKGGETIDAPAPYDSIPLYVRAGSILPFGPEIQYTTEKKPDPITLFIYQGADGALHSLRGRWADLQLRKRTVYQDSAPLE